MSEEVNLLENNGVRVLVETGRIFSVALCLDNCDSKDLGQIYSLY